MLRSTFQLYYALLAGQILFCLVTLYLIYQNENVSNRFELDTNSAAGLLIVISAGIIAFFMNNLRRQQAGTLRTSLQSRMMHYRTTVILRSAIMEAGNLFALILALIGFNLFPILYFLVGLLLFFFFRPSRSEFAQLYSLTGPERLEIE